MGAELNDYIPVLLIVVFAAGFAALAIVSSALIGKKAKSNPDKDTPYECGMPILSEAHTRFSVKFWVYEPVATLGENHSVPKRSRLISSHSSGSPVLAHC